MAKRNDPENDYIEQLQWKATHRRRFWPARYEPKWKYRIVYRTSSLTPVERAIWIAIGLVVIPSIVYLIVSDRLTEPVGEKIFLVFVFGMIAAILCFALRNASEDDEDDS